MITLFTQHVVTPVTAADGSEQTAPSGEARFRGSLAHAEVAAHRYAFSPSGAHPSDNDEWPTAWDWHRVTATTGHAPGTATTTLDDPGYTAVRVYLPPIGFSRPRVSIQIENTFPLDLIDFKIPAVVVIGPGHGEQVPVGETDTFSQVSEHDAVLDIGKRTIRSLKATRLHQANSLKVLLAFIFLSTALILANPSLFEDLRNLPVLKDVPKKQADRLGTSLNDSWVELAPYRQHGDFRYKSSVSYSGELWSSSQIDMLNNDSDRQLSIAEKLAKADKLFGEIRDILIAAWGPASMYMVTEEDRGESAVTEPSVSWMDSDNIITLALYPGTAQIGIVLEPIAAYTDDAFEPSQSWKRMFISKKKPNSGKLPADWRKIELGIAAPIGKQPGDIVHAPLSTNEKPGQDGINGQSEPLPHDADSSNPGRPSPPPTNVTGGSSFGLRLVAAMVLVTVLCFLIWLARTRKAGHSSKHSNTYSDAK